MSAEEKDEKEGEKKSSPLKMIIIIVVALAVLGGGGFFAYGKFFAKHEAEGGKAEASHATPEAAPVIQEMETFLVNLSDPGGKRYLKLTIKLRLSGPTVVQEVTDRNFELRDMILMILSGKEFADIASPEDKAALKQEILMQLNQVIKHGQIQDVYFTEFLVQ